MGACVDELRLFEECGVTYTVRITPHECERVGVHPQMNSVVFEAKGRVWWTPVLSTVRLDRLTRRELVKLLDRATQP